MAEPVQNEKENSDWLAEHSDFQLLLACSAFSEALLHVGRMSVQRSTSMQAHATQMCWM